MKIEEETRADVARRRLAQLTASFEGRTAEGHGAEAAGTDEAPAPSAHRLERQHLRVVGVVLAAAAVITIWWLLSARPHAEAEAPALPLSTSATPAKLAAPAVVIDVEGKVGRPGIVTLPKGSRVVDAIKAAGGLKSKGPTVGLNLARVLVDGEQILVGIAPAPGDIAGPAGAATGAKLSLNTATAEQLDGLPGVGPVTAKAILAWRTKNGSFTKVEDLLDVKGVGPATLKDLRDLVTP